MLKKITFTNKLKKIAGIAAIALCSLSVAACSGSGGDSKGEDTAVSDSASGDETVSGRPLPRYDVSSKMKAKGEKVDMSELTQKYKPMVKLADYKGIAVTKDEAYEMTEEEIDEEMDYMLESFRKYDDLTAGGTVQDSDLLTVSSNATVDGQALDSFSFEDMDYQVGSAMIAEDYDKQLIGKKAGEEFDINVTFPEDYIDEERLSEGDISLNGKTVLFKTKISKIQRAVEESMNDEWVKAHQEELAEYSFDGVNTVAELRTKIKSATEESRAVSLIKEFGMEALDKLVANSEFLSFPEDELNALKEQNISNLEQEFEAYKEMLGVNSIEEYLEMAYEITGDSGKDDYATEQAKEYLKTKMTIVLVADAAGIEIGEEDVKNIGNDMALYYGFDSYDSMLSQYGDTFRESAVFEALYDKVVSYLGSEADPSLEPEDSDDIMPEDLTESETEAETSAAG